VNGIEPSLGSITVADHADGPVMHLHGDCDAELLDQVGGAAAFDLPRIVAIDVSALGYIDSTGLALLVRWAESRVRTGGQAVVRGRQERFQRVLANAGLCDLFVYAE